MEEKIRKLIESLDCLTAAYRAELVGMEDNFERGQKTGIAVGFELVSQWLTEDVLEESK